MYKVQFPLQFQDKTYLQAQKKEDDLLRDLESDLDCSPDFRSNYTVYYNSEIGQASKKHFCSSGSLEEDELMGT
jgi:hypothetical protein